MQAPRAHGEECEKEGGGACVPPSWAISSTMAKDSLSSPYFGHASLMRWAFSWERTVVTTECPC